MSKFMSLSPGYVIWKGSKALCSGDLVKVSLKDELEQTKNTFLEYTKVGEEVFCVVVETDVDPLADILICSDGGKRGIVIDHSDTKACQRKLFSFQTDNDLYSDEEVFIDAQVDFIQSMS